MEERKKYKIKLCGLNSDWKYSSALPEQFQITKV